MLQFFADGLSHDPIFRSENNTMRRIAMTFVVGCLIAAAARDASAQMKPWEDRVYLNVGFGVESGNSTLADSRPLTIYEENGTVSASSTYTSGSLFDIGIGFRLWKNFSVGSAYHQEQNTADFAIAGTAPHPIFFNQPRRFTATAAGDQFRQEKAVHMQLGYMIPLGTKFDVMVFGGPSWFRLEQPVVSNVTISELGTTFAQVAVTSTVESRKKSPVGYNVGMDMSFMAWQNDSVRLGAGAFVRYARAKTNVLLLQTEQPTDVGGLQVGFGGRIRF